MNDNVHWHWILNCGTASVHYREALPALTDEELTFCLDHETRKTGLEQLLREARRRVLARKRGGRAG